ncbi:Ger(x)C family spore germination protein [Paenibacillus filicis]|uniref:Ger(X)C family spore germination protein n=1 Tax=Paenibacillus filicis TaxID=669464 RepID=A0ABU9DJC0_9BACL
MKRAIVCGLLLLIITGLLSGCWSRRELNNISIVVGLGLDKAGDQFKLTVQIVNPGQVAVKKSSMSNASPVVTYEETGKTVPEALARMTVKAPRRLYFAHLRMVIIGEDVAREGVGSPLDFLSRNMELRTDFFLVVARRVSASEVLKMNSAMDPIPSNNMFTKLETSSKLWAATGSITLNRLIQELGTKGKSPTLTGIEILGKRSQGDKLSNGQSVDPLVLLTYVGMAVFKEDRMVGWLEENDIKALNYVQNTVTQTTGTISCPGGSGEITMQAIRADSSIDVSMEKGVPLFDISIKIEQDIADVECDMDLSKSSAVSELKKISDAKLNELVEASIRKVQKQFKTDIYGFGDVFHRKFPKAWHGIKTWDDEFMNAKFQVRSDTNIRRMGTTMQSIKHETRE